MFYLIATIRTTQTDAKTVVIGDILIDHLWWGFNPDVQDYSFVAPVINRFKTYAKVVVTVFIQMVCIASQSGPFR